MFASQGLIMISLERLRQKRLIDYSFHMEKVFNKFMEDPSDVNFALVDNYRNYLRYLEKKLSISGFTKATFIWFVFLAIIEVTVIILYFYLVKNNYWIQADFINGLLY